MSNMKHSKVVIGTAFLLIVSIAVFLYMHYGEVHAHAILSKLTTQVNEITYSNNDNDYPETFIDENNERKMVHISGAVHNPGIVHIGSDSRVFEVIKDAGGTVQGADTDSINLAQVVVDGQKIVVPYRDMVYKEKSEKISRRSWLKNIKKHANDNSYNFTNKDLYKSHHKVFKRNSSAGNVNNGGLININSATVEELQSLPRVGPKTAERIIRYREENGLFASIEDIKKVNRIGEKTFQNMKDKICVH